MAPKLDPQQSSALLLTTLKNLNRPVSLADLVAQLKTNLSKPSLIKTLTLLGETGEIQAKLYGKTTIYCAKQNPNDVLAPEELSHLQSKIDSLLLTTPPLRSQLVSTLKLRDTLAGEPRTIDLPGKLLEVQLVCSNLSSLLSQLESQPHITPDVLSALTLSFQRTKQVALERGKISKELVAILLELEQFRKDDEAIFWEELGVDQVGDEVVKARWIEVREVENLSLLTSAS